jgi:phosphoribosyl 1,2-cyclic phosphodiesterase
MEVTFWGTRGSLAKAGPSTVRYGGNTSCVQIVSAAGTLVVLDCGTGAHGLGQHLEHGAAGAPIDGHILISHTHWDHVQGLPFFSPLYRAGNRVHIFARQRDMHLEAVFSAQHNAPYFPVPLAAMQADMNFHELIEGASFDIGKAKVTCARLNHPYVAIAYRVDVDGAAVVYCSDTAPFTDMLLGSDFVERPSFGTLPPPIRDELKAMRAGVVNLAKNADLLIYDTQFTPDEYKVRPHWGHSRPDDALEIAREAKVKQLCLFHHAPMRSDDENDKILEHYRGVSTAANDKFSLVSAYEGLEITLGDSK